MGCYLRFFLFLEEGLELWNFLELLLLHLIDFECWVFYFHYLAAFLISSWFSSIDSLVFLVASCLVLFIFFFLCWFLLIHCGWKSFAIISILLNLLRLFNWWALSIVLNYLMMFSSFSLFSSGVFSAHREFLCFFILLNLPASWPR